MNALTLTRPRRAMRALVLAIAALAIFALAATAARAANYVSLGDSYTAGPLIPNPVLPARLSQSSNNYPRLAAPSIGLPLRDPSCSGAKTDHMTQPQNVDPDGPNPPQFNSLDAETTVVSITIGGNDIGFAEVAQGCITLNPFSTPCKDKYTAGGKDQLAERIAATAPKVAAVLQGIHTRSPAAEVLRRQLPGDLPRDRVRLLAADADRVRRRALPALDPAETQRHAGDAGRSQRSDAGQLVRRQHRPRRLQSAARPAGSNRWCRAKLAAPIHPNKAGMTGAKNVLVAAVN